MSLPTGAPLIEVGTGSARWAAGTSAIGGADTDTEPQSFYLDGIANMLWCIQVAGAGMPGTNHEANGDLCLTRFTPNGAGTGWVAQDHCYLKGFGHGVSFSVDSSGSGHVVWIECASVEDSSGVGFGSKFTKINYVATSPPTTIHSPTAGWTVPNGAGDYSVCARSTPNVVVVRYRDSSNQPWYVAYKMSDVALASTSGPLSLTPLAGPLFEPLPIHNPLVTQFQGWTFEGNWLYTIDGYSKLNPLKLPNLINMTSLDLNNVHNCTDGYIRRALISADASASPREPEGVTYDNRGSTNAVIFSISNYAGAPKVADLWQTTATMTPPTC